MFEGKYIVILGVVWSLMYMVFLVVKFLMIYMLSVRYLVFGFVYFLMIVVYLDWMLDFVLFFE